MQYLSTLRGLKSAFLMMGVLLLSACGGGGSGEGGFTPPPPAPEVPEPVEQLFFDVVVSDSDGNSITAVPIGSIADITVTVTRGISEEDAIEAGLEPEDPVPVAGEVVVVTTDVGTVLPDGGTALTDAMGVAELQLNPGSAPVAGTLTVSVRGQEGSAVFNFQVAPSELRIGSFVDGVFVDGELAIFPANVAYGESAEVSLAVVDPDGELAMQTLTVTPNSVCAASEPPEATVPASVEVNGGLASFTYAPSTCVGVDPISAALDVAPGAPALGDITIGEPAISNLEFTSAEPEVLALIGNGSGDRPDRSVITFTLSDETGAGAEGVTVTFNLSTSVGGITLSNSSTITDGEGKAITELSSGTIPTSVVVEAIAAVNGTTLRRFSNAIAISGGLPDQNSMSVSSTIFVVEGRDYDGEEATFTVRMSDKQNNPVPEGTQITATTRYGNIDSNCATGADTGACELVWRSSNPRLPLTGDTYVPTIFNTACPAFTNQAFGPCPVALGPLATWNSVLFTAPGEESYIDTNGNGFYDLGELFQDLGEPFSDHNWDGVFNPAFDDCDPRVDPDPVGCASGLEETYLDTNENGQWDPGNNMYDGSWCRPEDDGVICSRSLINVRTNLAMIVSGSTQFVQLATATGQAVLSGSELRAGTGYLVYIADQYNNRPPSGSTVSITSDGCDLLARDDDNVADAVVPGAFVTSMVFSERLDNEDTLLGPVTIKVTTPRGDISETTFNCRDFANIPIDPPDPLPIFSLAIDAPNPAPSIAGESVINVRVFQNGAAASGIPVQGSVLVGSLQASSVTSENGIASFVYLGSAPGGDTFTASVADPNVTEVKETRSFNVTVDEFLLGFISGGVANETLIGVNPTVVSASELPRNVSVVADIFDDGGVRIREAGVNVEYIVKCADLASTVVTSATNANGQAAATVSLPVGCGASAAISARSSDTRIINTDPLPAATVTIQ